jgi:hypothetical protein
MPSPETVGDTLAQWQGVWPASAIDLSAIIADVAGRLGITEAEATPAVYAAADYIADDIGVAVVDFPTGDDRLNFRGIPRLAERMYQDQANPSGALNDYDPTYTGTMTPTRLYSHLDEYWRHLATQWGFA